MAKKKKQDDAEVLQDLINSDVLNAKSYFIKSGIQILDAFIAGEKNLLAENIGFPVSKIIGISGDNAVGKSTLMMEICKRLCKQDMKVLYIDVERGLNIKSLRDYGLMDFAAYNPDIDRTSDIKEINALKTECLNDFLEGRKLFYSVSPRSYNQIMRLIRYIFENNKKTPIKMIVIDSIKDAMATSVLDNDDEVEEKQMMVNAKAQEDFLIKLKNFITYQETACVIINQVRTKFKGQFAVLDEAGGQAWLHRADIRTLVKVHEPILKKVIDNMGETVEKRIGNWISILIKKGRFGNAFSTLVIPVLFGKGVSLILLYFRTLENVGVIKKDGYSFKIVIPELGIDEKGKYDRMLQILKERFVDIENYIFNSGMLFVEKDIDDNSSGIVNVQDDEEVTDIVNDL